MMRSKYALAGLSLLGTMLWGCGSSGGTSFSANGLSNSSLPSTPLSVLGRVNTLELIEPASSLQFGTHPPTVIGARGFDSQGNLVFGPVEVPFDRDVFLPGLPDSTTEVDVDYERASGYTMTSRKVAVDFLKDDDGVIPYQRKDLFLGAAARTTFTVKVVNNSKYADQDVYIAVNGKDAAVTGFYYLKFGAPGSGTATSTLFGSVDNSSDYSAALADLKKEAGDHTYSFQCPYENLISGRVFLSFGKKLEDLGLTDTANKLSLKTPSASGGKDYLKLFEFMELSVTSQPQAPQDFTIFCNTSVVDFFSIGLNETLHYQQGGQDASTTVGFEPGARQKVLDEFAKADTPDAFKRYIYVQNAPTNPILRVLAPSQSVLLDDGGQNLIRTFLDDAIQAGWKYYGGVVLNLPDNLPLKTYGFQYTGALIGAADVLTMTCAASTTAGEVGEVYNLPKPTGKTVFFCDQAVVFDPGDSDAQKQQKIRDSYNNGGSNAHKSLAGFILAALNRGVFQTYTDWDVPAQFYTRADKKYNWYAKILHQFAIDHLVYAFGYDDYYGQDPTLAKSVADVNQLIITIPEVPKLTP